MRVACDALAGETPIWMNGDSAYDTLNWHDSCRQQGVVPITPYNALNTYYPLVIACRVEDHIKEYSEGDKLK